MNNLTWRCQLILQNDGECAGVVDCLTNHVMNNGDYIPLDQEVIDQVVSEKRQKRQEAKDALRDALKNAGGNYDIAVFHDARKDYSKFKRIIKALDELGIFWCEHDSEILVSRHEVEDNIR